MIKSKAYDFVKLHRRGVNRVGVFLLFLLISMAFHSLFFIAPFSDTLMGEHAPLFFSGYDARFQLLPSDYLLSNALKDGSFWSFSMGLGGDVFTGTTFYCSTSIFFYFEYLLKLIFGDISGSYFVLSIYQLIISILKQSLTLFFTYSLLRYERRSISSSLVGTMIYGLCPWFALYSVRVGFMTGAMMWIPLCILAFKKYQKSGNWITLAVACAFMIGNNFYFGFISGVFLISYFLIFSFEKGERLRLYLLKVLKLVGVGLVALLLSAVCFLPAMNGLLGADRTQAYFDTSLLMAKGYAAIIYEYLFSTTAYFSFPSFVILALVLSFSKMPALCRKKCILAGVWLILWTMPIIHGFFNGMSYKTDRWIYILIFAIAYGAADWLDELKKLKWIKKYCALLIFAMLLLFYTREQRGLGAFEKLKIHLKLPLILSYALNIIVIVIIAVYATKFIEKHKLKKLCSGAIVLCVLVSCLVIAMGMYARYSEKSLGRNESQSLIAGSAELETVNKSLIPAENDFYRVEDEAINTAQERSETRSYVNGNYTVSDYNSQIPSNIHQWIKRKLNVYAPLDNPSYYRGFDGRRFLETAWGVKYKLNGDEIPFGYKDISPESGSVKIYENTLNTGFDMWYERFIAQAELEKLDYAQRDAVLLQAAVVEGKATSSAPAYEDATSTTALQPEDFTLSNCTLNGDTLTANKGAELIYKIPKQEEAGEFLFSLKIKSLEDKDFDLTVNDKSVRRYNDKYDYAYKSDEFSFRLAGEAQELKISVTEGKYRLEKLRIAFNSYEKLEEWIGELNAVNIKNLSIKNGKITGTVDAPRAGLLALSMPYSKGWSLKINGKRAELKEVNGVFAGIELSAGHSDIKLSYFPPYLLLGLIITALTALSLLAWCKHKTLREIVNKWKI
ncbi:MAG: YfhO family protein [Oscillospiraceae bacterium]|jgi:uncharacterized membrane protein YfhO|nr:YfhO family protein [Oscillospiraceae bacterium]